MFMSMGEPMLNYKNVAGAIRLLNWGYPQADLLISTMGPFVDYQPFVELSQEISKVGLQFSIHESTNEARDELIPFKQKIGIWEISQVGEHWHNQTGRYPFFNYCAHEGNSSVEDARRLAVAFNPFVWKATVSVVCERDNKGLPTTNQKQRDLATNFSQRLVDLGFDVRVFDPAGQDTIGGGCGQLWFVQDWVKKNPELVRCSVGTGLPKVHVPSVV
jgi:23S rRNA (adenine2503-C2)-methyltransferase